MGKLKERFGNTLGKIGSAVATWELLSKLWHIGQFLTAGGLTWLVWAQAQMADVPTFVVTAACIAVFTLVLGGWRFLVPIKTTTTVLQFGSATNDAVAIRLFADQLPRAAPKELDAPLVKGRRLYLYDVPRVNGIIQGRTFEDRVVEGPAIVRNHRSITSRVVMPGRVGGLCS